MMKPKDPRDLAEALLSRSSCAVQVAAVLTDRHGVHGWGWNNSGRDGMGEHAEVACLRRANRRRALASTLYVAAQRARNGRTVTARPCIGCMAWITRFGVGRVVWRDANGGWNDLV